MEKRYFQPEIETMPVDEIKKIQSEKLVKQVKHVSVLTRTVLSMLQLVRLILSQLNLSKTLKRYWLSCVA